eukprot:gnl/MRDRNA2_/MRDRNA2_132720_c0_seq1.p1 gnl/MRDRNA2_/MRDRNA2_132720_c0~~gnl/MRDRNA2_/MRDRNA2_132720_c0_seq1.p1  ORF type:complete len:147 (-),score=37.88 gnl/MRDRNA2_/MRDRNA2_132720_c0_seq1:316-756(-)
MGILSKAFNVFPGAKKQASGSDASKDSDSLPTVLLQQRTQSLSAIPEDSTSIESTKAKTNGKPYVCPKLTKEFLQNYEGLCEVQRPSFGSEASTAAADENFYPSFNSSESDSDAISNEQEFPKKFSSAWVNMVKECSVVQRPGADA